MKTLIIETRSRCAECGHTWAERRPIVSCRSVMRRVALAYLQDCAARYWGWFVGGALLGLALGRQLHQLALLVAGL